MSLSEYYTIPMTVPLPSYLADVIRSGLKPNFEEVVVEWVNCPDLTQEPFKLVAPGLCGNTTILQVGGTGHMFPEIKREVNMNLFNLIHIMKRWTCNNFVIGGCITPCNNNYFGELTVNAFIRGKTVHDVYGSRMVYWGRSGRRTSEISTFRDHKCALMGNFYISEGKPGNVLKVYAKRRTGNVEFINAMQSALASHFPATYLSDQCIGLGGVFLANQGTMRHYTIPHSWEEIRSQKLLRYFLHYFNIEAPLISVGTFLNTDRHIATRVFVGTGDERPCIKPMPLTTRQFHTFGPNKAGGFYERDLNPDVVEYLGYFYPAEIMYRVAPSVNPQIPNLYVS